MGLGQAALTPAYARQRGPITTASHRFTPLFVLALTAGLIAAAILSPFAAWGLAAAGFPFPLPAHLRSHCDGNAHDRADHLRAPLSAMGIVAARFRTTDRASRPTRGLAVALALAVIAALFAIAGVIGCGNLSPVVPILAHAAKYAAAAILIGIIEEGFFRALLLAGIRSDYSPRAALLWSSAFYAFTHVLRSPAHFYLTGFHPLAGFQDLGLSAARLAHPAATMPSLVGLFLLGIILGEAFILSGTVYFSIGLHAGFVIGAKAWPAVTGHSAVVPRWLAGPGPVPLIAAPAAWIAAAAIAFGLPFFLRQRSD